MCEGFHDAMILSSAISFESHSQVTSAVGFSSFRIFSLTGSSGGRTAHAPVGGSCCCIGSA